MKALDQDARGFLRKHGVRFGQFTIFMPALLKPAPTRLRLVLWALSKDLGEFPESPPPGLVTVPSMSDSPQGTDTMAGYRNAGTRAIRIDMLERLADMLRSEDSRGGFEAKADMLSITGMTLEQFADLMQGLGYKAEQGERVKVKVAPASEPAPEAEKAADDAAVEDATVAETAPAEDAPAAETPAEDGATSDDTSDAAAPAEDAEAPEAPEMEVFYTFAWGGGRPNKNRGRPTQGDQPQRKGGGKRPPQGNKGGGKQQNRGKGQRDGGKSFSARPPKKEKTIDPDNPFAAALMGLKDNS